jgi:hypothetical protein
MTKKKPNMETNKYSYEEDYNLDLDNHDSYIVDFDAYEAMLMGQVYDSVSRSINKSSITDSYSATLLIERSSRVMAKTPEGVLEPSFKSDSGKAAFLNIVVQKYVYKNANSQRTFKQKLRLWQLYSGVYGYMVMFYDWNVARNGYIGPDCWLWNPRNFIPQAGRVSIEDMDYCHALAWVSKKTLEGWLEDKDGEWDKDALKDLIELADKQTSGKDTKRQTKTERDRNNSDLKKGICIATRYEAGDDGHWVSFAPENGFIQLRDIPNPHRNGRLPFVVKYSQPLFDSFYGMGDFQRAKPLQFARDGLTNFYFKGIQMNLLPPIVANSNGVMKHTLDYRAGGIILETLPNSVRRLETSTAGLATYQAAQSQLTGSLLSQFGTQNASIPGAEALNPSKGKTPAAINDYTEKEATRDGQEREYLEQAIEELTDGFVSMIVNIGTESIPVNLMLEDLKMLEENGYDDVLKMVQPNEAGDMATLIVDPIDFRGSEFRFNITTGTTAAINKSKQKDELVEVMTLISKFQNQIEADPSVKVNWGKMMESLKQVTNVPGIDEFITILPPEVVAAQQQQQMEMQAQAQAATMEAQQPEQQSSVAVRGQTFAHPVTAGAAQEIDKL